MVPDRWQQWNVRRLKPLQNRRLKAPPHGIQLLTREASHLTRDHVASTHHQIRLQANELIQLGALGSGPRPLLDGEAPAQQSFTLLEIDGGRGTLRETTYAVSTGRPISWSTLPLRLNTRAGLLQRNASERLLRG